LKIHFNPGSAAIGRGAQNQGFTCNHCGANVLPLTNGSYRNHCPVCLYSKHVDIVPGDRASACRGLMPPIRLEHRPGKGQVIVHRCQRCGHVRPNRVAMDTVQPDDLDELIRLAARSRGGQPG
jgi:RNHCP domain